MPFGGPRCRGGGAHKLRSPRARTAGIARLAGRAPVGAAPRALDALLQWGGDEVTSNMKQSGTGSFIGRVLAGCALVGAVVFSPAVARADEGGAPPRLKEGEHFTINPVLDGMLIVGGFAFSELLSRIIASNELTPLPPGDPKNLNSIDRSTVTQTIYSNANGLSNLGLYAAYAYALLDPILIRRARRAARIPRRRNHVRGVDRAHPGVHRRHQDRRAPAPGHRLRQLLPPMTPPAAGCDSTDLQLSFFSGHTSVTAAISATATYLAFVGAPHTKRPWITLAAGTLLTGFVCLRARPVGNHFPTTSSWPHGRRRGLASSSHLHRRAHYHDNVLKAPQVWIGFAPETRGGGQLTLGGQF